MATTVVTVAVGAIGLIVGWFVSGYQHVTEKLTEDRRKAYLNLLIAADDARDSDSSEASQRSLDRAAKDAEFVCSNEMLHYNRIGNLVTAIRSDTWKEERKIFFEVARYESQRNSYWGRHFRKRRKYAREVRRDLV